jgi:CubicO group peptidase (beta-lactamase class C family)
MKRHITGKYFLTGFLVLYQFYYVAAQELPTSKPAELGFSDERLDRIDQLFEAYVEDSKMAGSVILVARKGKVGYFKAFGFQDIEKKTAMKEETIFRIASQSKAIVSVAVMILQEEGRLLI